MKLPKKIAALLTVTLVASSSANLGFADTTNEVSSDKLVGAGRWETAIEVSKKGWEKSSAAVIVNDSSIADALAATPFAKANNAPILLTQKDKLYEVTKSELKRLGVKKVYLIGGEAVLSENIEMELKAQNIEIDRIYGETRELTALEIANRLDKINDKKVVDISNKSSWDGKTKTEVTANKNGVYEINNPGQLAWIAEFVNSGNTNISIKLNSDIDLNNKEWTSIGTSENPFKGSFDGGNYAIKNLSINKEESSNLGLFGVADSGVSIKNIILDGVNIVGYEMIGSLVGSVYDGQTSSKSEEIIQNCYVKNVSISCHKNYVGGLVGYGYIDIKKCSVDKVSISTEINLVKGDSVGGVIGYLGSKRTLSDVTASNLTLSGTRQIGGIAGCADGSETLFKNCTVQGKTSINASGISMKGFYPYAGGILGEVVKKGVSIKNCFVYKETVSISGNNSNLLGWFVGGSSIYEGESFKFDLVKFVDTKNLGCNFKSNSVFKENNMPIEDKREVSSLFAVDAMFSDDTIEVGIILNDDVDIRSYSKDNIAVSYLKEDDSIIKINDKNSEGYLKNFNGRKYSKKLKSSTRYCATVNSSSIGNNVLEGFEDVAKVKVEVKIGDKIQEVVLENTIKQ